MNPIMTTYKIITTDKSRLSFILENHLLLYGMSYCIKWKLIPHDHLVGKQFKRFEADIKKHAFSCSHTYPSKGGVCKAIQV